MELLPKIALIATGLALLVYGGRARSQARTVTRGLAVGDSLLAQGGAINFLKQQTRAPWDNVAVVGASSRAVLQQAQAALQHRGVYSHVVALAGANDGDNPASFTKQNLTQIYALAKAAGAQVVAISETPFKGYAGLNQAGLERHNEMVRWLISGEGSRLANRVVDANTQLSDPRRPGYLDQRYAAIMRGDRPDWLHLNNDGQRLLGALILQAIRR
jgi:lysophospholipase L1-like esterase